MSLNVALEDPNEEGSFVYEANITHNLNRMASEAGLYAAIWRPDENGYEKAKDIIEPIRTGLILLKSDPDRFMKFEATNGWGLYVNFVPFVERYLAACEGNPEAIIHVSR